MDLVNMDGVTRKRVLRVAIVSILLLSLSWSIYNLPKQQVIIASSPPIPHDQVPDFIQTEEGGFYIFDIASTKLFPGELGDIVVATGWMRSKFAAWSYKCCFRFGDASVISIKAKRRHPIDPGRHLLATQFECSAPVRELSGNPHFLSVSLVARNVTCPTNSNFYSKVVPSYQQEGQPSGTQDGFAVCGKVVYGSKPATEIVEWVEYHRYFGVSKILTYKAKNLNADAERVLEYYAKTGFLECRPYGKIPENATIPRHLWEGGYFKWNDDFVVIYDAQERLKEFKYAMLIDIDEYIYLTNKTVTSYTQMMERLLKKWPESVGFSFHDHVFTKTWGKTNPSGDMQITQYTNRTATVIDLVKHAYVNERLEPGYADIHAIRPRWQYRGPELAPESEAVVRHYRVCQPSWVTDTSIEPNKCLGMQRIRDDSMLEIADKIRPRVDKVKSLLGLKPSGK